MSLCLVTLFLVSNERQTYLKKKKVKSNSYPIKKNFTFFKGNRKWEISQTTLKDKTSAYYNDTVTTQLQRILKGTIYQNNSKKFLKH